MTAGPRSWRRRLAGTASTVVVLAGVTPAWCIAGAEGCVAAPNDSASSRVGADRGRPGRERAWSSPLDHPISLHTRPLSLRSALDRIATAGRFRLSYSTELLPLDRAVCLSADSVAAGDVLADLLAGTAVSPVSAAADQVVLAPTVKQGASGDGHGERESSPAVMARGIGLLDRVVVTGSADGAGGGGAPQRQLAVAVDVVDGRQLAQQNAGTLADALDAAVPGIWGWEQSPVSLLTSYGSIRGASSFGVSYPKIYIDGIEVANPLLVSHFNADAIDHLEVIRGPQGAALYGTDAISGVINIVTRHDGVSPGGEHAMFKAGAGLSQSAFVSRAPMTQQYALTLGTGSSTRSASMDVSMATMGDFAPQASSRQVVADGAARMVGARASVSGTARFFAEDAGMATSPLLSSALPPPVDTGLGAAGGGGAGGMRYRSMNPQTVREYTLGGTATFAQSDRWTHSVVLGMDGYQLANVATSFTPIPSAADSLLRAAQGSAIRGTARLSSVAQFGSSESAAATLTLAAEHSELSQTSSDAADMRSNPGSAPGMPNGGRRSHRMSTEPATPVPEGLATWQSNSGLVAQTNASLRNSFFATGGIRLEENTGLIGTSGIAVLPMIGGDVVQDRGPFTVKLRAAYGKGIRPPEVSTQAALLPAAGRPLTQNLLGNEQQSGVEAGVDLGVARMFEMQVTRFDQRASGLIQSVAVPADSVTRNPRLSYTLQNVGEISNRGWEMQGKANISRLSLSGTLSLVDSRVLQLARGYTGDLEPGDRTLGVPAKTTSVAASYTGSDFFGSLSLTRAFDWITYDQLALAREYMSGALPTRRLVGRQLRQYWSQYGGVDRVRATFSRELGRGIAFEVTGDNLLNIQSGEPDNITALPGRTFMTSLKMKF